MEGLLVYAVFLTCLVNINVLCVTIGDGCVTTDGSNGTCLRIGDCPKYSSLLKESPIPQNVRDILKKATCGLSDDKKPLLCCPMETIVQTSQVRPWKPEGYLLLPGVGYYKHHREHRDFYSAVKVCEEEGSHLAVLNSEKECKALSKLSRGYSIWIGLHDPDKNGDFKTIFGTPMNETGFSTWQVGQPNGQGEEHCVILLHQAFNDGKCEWEDDFICEHHL